MRLIDADKVLEETRRDRDYAEKHGFMDMYYERQALIDRIEAQSIAYDVDKVVEQLNDKFRVVQTDEDLEWNRAMDEAITIVKGGGVYAKTDS